MHRPEFIPFNRPAITGAEEAYLAAVMARGKFAAGGRFSKSCNAWLKEQFGHASSYVLHRMILGRARILSIRWEGLSPSVITSAECSRSAV